MARTKENCDKACDRIGLKCSEEEFEKHKGQVDTCGKMKMLMKDLKGLEVDKCDASQWEQSDVPVLEFKSDPRNETVAYHSRHGKSKSAFHCTSIPPSESEKKRRLCFCHGIDYYLYWISYHMI